MSFAEKRGSRPAARWAAEILAAVLAAGVLAGGCTGWPQTVQEKRAFGDARLKAMGERLGGLQDFSFAAEEYHLRSAPSPSMAPGGELTRRDLVREVVVRRPDAAWFGSRGDRADQIWYESATLTLLSEQEKSWAEAQVPGRLDEALGEIGARVELLQPMTDLLSGALWDAGVAPDRSGGWVAIETIGKKKCDRLVYSQKAVDWQIWIEEGASALPCQLMLVYKSEPGPARSTLIFRDWKLAAAAPAGRFRPVIPEGYRPLGKLARRLAETVPAAPVAPPEAAPRDR